MRRAAAAALLTAALLAAACSGSSGSEPSDPAQPDGSSPSGDASADGNADPTGTGVNGDGTDGADDSDGATSSTGPAGTGTDTDASSDASGTAARPADGTQGSQPGTNSSGDGDTAIGSEPQGPIAPLTGAVTTESDLDQRRAVAVKIGNADPRSRPQAGLASADLVYEMLIEGARTRFLAVFHSDIPARIGPVRSGRSGDIDLLADLAAPLLITSGANDYVTAELRAAERAGVFVDLGAMSNFDPYSRDDERRSPFNLYFHYPNITADGAPVPGGPPAEPLTPLFSYGSPNPAPAERAAGVTVTYHHRSGHSASHVWDARRKGWVRIQEGEVLLSETDEGLTEVAPANVVVLWVRSVTSPADPESPQTVSYGSGDALILTNGAVHEGVWQRTEGEPGIGLRDKDDNPLSLTPGSTWVLLANQSRSFAVATMDVVTAREGAFLLAEARSAVFAGN